MGVSRNVELHAQLFSVIFIAMESLISVFYGLPYIERNFIKICHNKPDCFNKI